MNSVFEELKQNAPDVSGYVWLNMLIKFNPLTGKSELVRSFVKPAQDSKIKSIVKPKKAPKGPKFVPKKAETTEKLF